MGSKETDTARKLVLLGKAALFAQLSSEELEAIARYSGYRDFASGELIFAEGTAAGELYLVDRGSVIIRKRSEGVEQEQDIAQFVAGEAFGEMDLLDSAPRSASAIAEGATTLLAFPASGSSFPDIIERHPELFAPVLQKLLGVIAGRIRAVDRLVSEKTPWVQELKRQLLRDKLTGLHNRTFLDEELQHLLDRSPCTSLLTLKPDNFKAINDGFGHEAGDRTLVLIAEAVKSRLSDGDIGARCRGDEFCVVLPGRGEAEAAALADTLLAVIRGIDMAPITGRGDFPFTASIGLSMHPTRAADAKALVAGSFEAMWTARNTGGDRLAGREGA